MQPRISALGPGGIESHPGSGSQQLCTASQVVGAQLGAGSSSMGVLWPGQVLERGSASGTRRQEGIPSQVLKCWGPGKGVAVTLRTVGSGC